MSNHFCALPKYGKSSRTFSVARELVALGHEVAIVTASYSHSRSENPDVVDPVTVEMIDGVKVIFLKTPKYDTTNKLSRIANILGFLWRYIVHVEAIQNLIEPEVVVEGTAYIVPFFPARRLAKKSNARMVLELRDLWPMTLYELGVSRYNPIAWCLGRLQGIAIGQSEALVSSLRFADVYFKQLNSVPKRFHYVPNAADDTLFKNKEELAPETAQALADIKNSHAGIVGYAGSIGIANSVDLLVEAAVHLGKDEIAFVVFGEGARKKSLEQRVKELKLTNVFFFDPVPKRKIFQAIAQFDLGFVGGRVRAVHQFGVSPNKLYDYMICKVPVLFCLATQDDLIKENGAGISIYDPDLEKIIEGIRGFFALSSAVRDEMGHNGYEAIQKSYTYTSVSKDYGSFLKSIAQTPTERVGDPNNAPSDGNDGHV